jgi:isoleucyl-tRNA synthetase
MYGFDEKYQPSLSERDMLVLEKNEVMYDNCLKYYEDYDFKFVLREVVAWVSELSSSYLDDTTKSFLYECDLDGVERLNCQYVLKDCLEKMVKVLAPMTPFLVEDAYQNYLFKKCDSVFMEQF